MGLWDTNPADWSFEESVGETKMDQEVRDRMKAVLHLRKGFGFSSGQGNGAGGADTQLTSYDHPILANEIANPGSGLIVEGTLVVGTPSEAKTCKLQVGGGTAVEIYSQTAASHIVPFRMVVRRRTSTGGSITGIVWVGAAAGGTPTPKLVNAALGTVDWTIQQILKVYLSGNTADSIKLSDYWPITVKGDGVLV